jgi:exoribonuclease R
MTALVEIRGGKAYLVPAGVRLDGGRGPFIAGDRVTADGSALIERTPTYAIGVVGVNGRVRFPHHPAFWSVARGGMGVGERLLVWLDASGGVHERLYGGDDTRLVREFYRISANTMTEIPFRIGPAHYTEEGVVDHTDLETVTVDPPTTVDLDDAISVDVVRGILYVHIVDIHTAIAPGSTIDMNMLRHAVTLYLANEVTEHLMPLELVSICSLNTGEIRRAITVRMMIDSMTGSVIEYGIYRSLIRVGRRLSYSDLAQELGQGIVAFRWLQDRALAETKSITLAIPGLELDVGPDGQLRGVAVVNTNDIAHRMVSYAMIAANFVVSAHLRRRGVILPNRFHEAVRQVDVEAVTGDSIVDSFIAVKRWRRARYDVAQSGHFGLGLTNYCHFTSPMRRYADVLVHRVLAGVVYDVEWLVDAVEALNERVGLVRRLHEYYRDVKIARHLTEGRAVLGPIWVTQVSAAGIMWYAPRYLVGGFAHVSCLGTYGQRWRLEGEVLRSEGSEIRAGSRMCGQIDGYDAGTASYLVRLEVNPHE